MTILWIIHLYPPIHNCGAEYMAHNLNKFLMSNGHHVRVLLKQANQHKITKPYDYEGVNVMPPTVDINGLMATSDVVFTHLDYTQDAVNLARRFKKPCYHFVHNSSPYPSIINAPEVNVVYNSEWIGKALGYVNKSFVLRPPCDYRQYDVVDKPEQNEYITLINLDQNKGGQILAEIAKKMPEKKFIGVQGSYSVDANGQYLQQPPNVTVLPNTPDILSVYRKTRVLIMPSLYESWGRTATEAMCNGIPVIAHKTEGLAENLDYAGLFADREKIDEWVTLIKKLDDKKFYKKQSELSRKRSRELDPIDNMKNFNKWLFQH